MSGMPAPIDASELAALSEGLGISARQLLIAGARLAEMDAAQRNDPECLLRVLDDAKRGDADANASAQMLLTPIAGYAIDDLDRLFATIWPASGAKQGV
ncbi:MAG: hypothetical protein ACREPX_06070 [Rhodanobacteraceae bacterium]